MNCITVYCIRTLKQSGQYSGDENLVNEIQTSFMFVPDNSVGNEKISIISDNS